MHPDLPECMANHWQDAPRLPKSSQSATVWGWVWGKGAVSAGVSTASPSPCRHHPCRHQCNLFVTTCVDMVATQLLLTTYRISSPRET